VNKVAVNGQVIEISGDAMSVSIMNGKVYIDGKLYDTGNGVSIRTLVIHGNVGDASCDGSLEISGNVSGNASAGGSIRCGDVSGNVSAGGSIRCGDVGGSATASGSLRKRGL